MQPYARNDWKRLTDHEAVAGLMDRAAERLAMLTPGSPAWRRFLEAFEEALSGAGANLATLAHCLRFSFRRQTPLSEEPLAEAWCGQPQCPSCARERAAEAVRHAKAGWADQDLAVVELPIGRPGGLELPSNEAVAGVREAWGRATRTAAEATGLERLAPLPLSALTPDGLSLFVPLQPATAQEAERLLPALHGATRQVGLVQVRARVLPRDQAAMRLYRSLVLESERFLETVLIDLERIDAFPWDTPSGRARGLRAAAGRWVSFVRHRQETARRKTVFSGRGSLSVGTAARPAAPFRGRIPACGEEVVVRDVLALNRIVWRGGDPFAGKRTRQAIGEFCAALAKTSHSAARRAAA